MVVALRGSQQRDCSGVSPDSLLSRKYSVTPTREIYRSALSTKPPQRYNNFPKYQDLPPSTTAIRHISIERSCGIYIFCTFAPRFAPRGLLLLATSSDEGEPLAQLVEHNTFNVGVMGSSPMRLTKTQGLKTEGHNHNQQVS